MRAGGGRYSIDTPASSASHHHRPGDGAVQVCHFPPGTSKWNKIEHRLFCHITNNWRGRPLLTRQVVVNLIGGVSTAQGLRVKAALDENIYDADIKVSDAELATVSIERGEFHGEWNYCIKPRYSRRNT